MYSPSRINYDLKSDSTTDSLIRMAIYDALQAYGQRLISFQEFNRFVAEITAYVAV